MVDIHAHLIPFVDDGSNSLHHSLTMLKEMTDMGITDIVCTPHFRGNYDKTKEELERFFNEFKDAVVSAGIKVNLYLGEEIYCSNFKELISSNKVFTLNGTKFVLLEFGFNTESEIVEEVYTAVSLGYKPIVAHIERYDYVTLEDVYEIKSFGGYVQVNAESVAGKVKRFSKKLVKKLFREDLVDFVASDIHTGRTNYYKKAYDKVLKKYGKEVAEKVFTQNAKEIIKS